jgi:hypothetical protein
VWRAGNWDTDRSIPFRDLIPLFDSGAVSWYALQLDRRPEERHRRLNDLDSGDPTRLASAVAALDLVISIDSMPAHLSGAIGTRVWTLLMRNADWRWMTRRDDTPWYPTMKLFRQDHQGWPGVIERVRDSLGAAL